MTGCYLKKNLGVYTVRLVPFNVDIDVLINVSRVAIFKEDACVT